MGGGSKNPKCAYVIYEWSLRELRVISALLWYWPQIINRNPKGVNVVCTINKYHQRFFDQVGHQTKYASMGNKHFITK